MALGAISESRLNHLGLVEPKGCSPDLVRRAGLHSGKGHSNLDLVRVLQRHPPLTEALSLQPLPQLLMGFFR
jgi:hypothetical protein